MSGSWIEAVVRAAAMAPVVRAVVIEAKGSTPREAGAWMVITRKGIEGTIGGGALEHACIERARGMLDANDAAPWLRMVERFHLGPELNQCCGGAVAILLERFGVAEAAALAAAATDGSAVRPLLSGAPIRFEAAVRPGVETRDGLDWWAEPAATQRTALFIYGAGHVGRAVVRALDDLPFAVTWYDGEREGHTDTEGASSHMTTVAVGPGRHAPRAHARRRDDEKERWNRGREPMLVLARAAPPGAFHLIMTHSHTLDEAIVGAILSAGRFGYLGLIGSATKRARFSQRLMRAGLAGALVEQIHCPIGLPGLAGKAPAVIAASVAADLLLRRQKQIDPGAAVQ